MQQRTAASLVFLSSLVVLHAFASGAHAMTLIGGAKEQAPDASGLAAAQFAVGELNSKNDVTKDGALSLGSIVSYKTQVVAGTNHIMTIQTTDGAGKAHAFDVTVWEKLPGQANDGPYQLTHYKPAAGAVAEVSRRD